MYRFLQFVKDGKEAWRKYTLEQLDKADQLPGTPTFQTILAVDQDPDEVAANDLNPLDTVKYLGPMYFDLDDANDLDRVLDDARAIVDCLLHKLDVPAQFINVWLSGGKGVHITLASELFGVKSPVKFLPLIYREIMLTVKDMAGLEKVSTIDESVYSCGRGRMWRTEGWMRPKKETYKIAVTLEELAHMDSDGYQTLVSQPRPHSNPVQPGKGVTSVRCSEIYGKARSTATRKARALMEAVQIPKEVFRTWDGTPGCVQKLIDHGHHDGESNWNQAAMQLAAYIAARYEKQEEAEYLELVKQFVHNVSSTSRPSESERMKHVKGQLTRMFQGTYKFSPGALIHVIGRKCGSCPVCRADIAKGETDQVNASEESYHHITKISWDDSGYYLVGDTGKRQLTTFTFWPHTEVFALSQTRQEGPRIELHGTIIDDAGGHFEEEISEGAWASKKEFLSAFKGLGEAQTYCGEGDLQRLLKAIMYFARKRAEKDGGLNKMTRSTVCGVVLERTKDGALVPHFIESAGAITNSGRSHFSYDGEVNHSSALMEADYPYKDDTELEITLTSLAQINEPVAVGLTLGWFASNHFREHIQFDEPQYPLLNINGNAGAGKTSLASLMAHINGMDYTKQPYMNVEVGTMYPLIKFITSSTTVPRLIEEVNPLTCGNNYARVVGLFKSSWNKAPVNRGQMKDKEMGINDDRVSSPIVFTSEQTATNPALRDRTVEVSLQSKTRKDPKYKHHYETAMARRMSLFRFGKALLRVAMNTHPEEIMEIFRAKSALIREGVNDRPRWSYQTCLLGLHMVIHTMEDCGIGGVEEIRKLENAVVKYLGGNVIEDTRGKSASEVGKVLEVYNILADDTVELRDRLRPGKHYWMAGDTLYLVVQSCHPGYLRYMKSIGEPAAIRFPDQMVKLLEGEVYHIRTEDHPGKPARVYAISIKQLADAGVLLNNFVESDYEGEEG